jgi:alpha-L-fucosidase 2
MFKLKYDRPASLFSEAFVLGNGSLGATVYGGFENEIIRLNCDTLWSGTVRNEEKKVPEGFLDTIRTLIFEGKYVEAGEFSKNNLPTDDSASFLPMGNLNIRFDKWYDTKNYSRTLDISTATAEVKSGFETTVWNKNVKHTTRKYWISKPHGVMVCEIESENIVNLTVSTDCELDYKVKEGKNSLYITGRAPSYVLTTEQVNRDPNTPPYIYESDDTVRFCYSVTAVYDGGSCHAENGTLYVRGTKKVTFIIAAETNFVTYDKIPDKKKDLAAVCRARTEKAISDGIDKVYADHVADYKSLFDRVELKLGGEESDLTTDRRIAEFDPENPDLGLVELLFHFGRYLLISSSREGTQPTNLQGIWNHQVIPDWRSNYTTNINTEMNYWMAEVCNLSECHEPLMKMIKELSVAGEKTAKNIYGCRGFAVHHNVDLWRKTSPANGLPIWNCWAMSGAWLCAHLWQRYTYTRDAAFLRDTAFPITEKSARFLLDFLTEDKEGNLVTAPSTSPENQFITPEGKACVCYASGMDMSIIRENFIHLIQMRDELGVKSEIADEAEKALKRLRPFGIDSKGRLMEWNEEFKENESGHRHLSHLYGIYPGDLIKNSDSELWNAARKSLDYRLSHGGGHTGWSCAWIVCLMATFGDGEEAWNMLSKFFSQSVCANMLDNHPPFQIDGNFGITAGIAAMLLKEENGEIKLLPALPKSWKNGEVRGLRLTNNRSISFKWENGRVVSQEIV